MTETPASQSAAKKQPDHLHRPAMLSLIEWLKEHPNTIRITAVIAFFVFWEFIARDMNTLFMSYPTAIFRAAWAITESGELPQAFVTSMEPFLLGLAISIVGGVVIGVLIAQFWFLEYTLDPFINALYAVPRTAKLFVMIIVVGVLGAVLNELVIFIERRFSRWRVSERERY